ncbi:MAG TPA: HEAT repeat domain-containing protein, partial [Planctomycetota bacterium]|nr:HEAT repeat domain-containing protein [Planctomycetota bacterium]
PEVAVRGGAPLPAPIAADSGPTDNWETWWETNKFDFIELRRVDDPMRSSQGTTSESPQRRELRLASVRAGVRDKVLPTLRDLARSDDAAVRAASIVALGKLRDHESVELARSLLADPSFEVRRSSILALGVLTSGRASWLLLHIADDSRTGRTLIGSSPVSVDDRGIALLAACLRGDDSAGQLLERLITDRDGAHPELIALAADAAGLMASPDLVRPLVDLAFDASVPQYVRSSAASALGRIGDPSATPALVELLGEDHEPRRAASVALGEVGHPGEASVIDRLAALLRDESDAPTRHFAAISLGRIGGDRSRQALERALDDADDDMRPWIVLGLGLCERSAPSGSVAPRLLRMCESEGNSSTLAALHVALGLSRSVDALPRLVDGLASPSSQVAGAAAIGLGLSGHPQAVDPLRASLSSSSDPEVLRQAALGLGILGDTASQSDLLELMWKTRDPYVASFAAIGVAFLGDSEAAPPLLELIRRSGPTGLTTLYAATALGQLFDTDRRPALSRLASSDNYLARTTAVDDLLALGF